MVKAQGREQRVLLATLPLAMVMSLLVEAAVLSRQMESTLSFQRRIQTLRLWTPCWVATAPRNFPASASPYSVVFYVQPVSTLDESCLSIPENV